MIRSKFAISRLILLPYILLMALHLVVVGGGGVWLYLQARVVESRMLVDNLTATVEPLSERLESEDAMVAMRDGSAWLVADISKLFAKLPTLRSVSIRGRDAGYQMGMDAAGKVVSHPVIALPPDGGREVVALQPDRRLHEENAPRFVLWFDLAQGSNPPVRLEFAFDRTILLALVNRSMAHIKWAILIFGGVGAFSIFLAMGITFMAMRTTRKLENHFQTIYQRASVAESAAQLVHDLRNHLAALRSNNKALLVSPQQVPEIVADMDQEIVRLNAKLTAFLDLNRRRDDSFSHVDVGELIEDALRLARPVLAEHGLSVETKVAPVLSPPLWQRTEVLDALLNVILNAAQSGQRDGAIRVTVELDEGRVRIAVEDQGRGIDKRHMPHIFDSFYTTREEGIGLGLAIVHKIVAHHQGQVYAENRPGGGASVVLELPLQPKEAPSWWKKFKKRFPV